MHIRRTSIFLSSVLASSVFALASVASGCGSPVRESFFEPDGGEWDERDGDGCDAGKTTASLQACATAIQVTPSAAGSSAQLTAEFTQALNVVRGRAFGCEFALQAPTATSAKLDPKKINVVWKDGAADHIVSKDPNNGWKYDKESSPTKVIFSGRACTNVSNDPNSAISVVVGCASLEGECL